MIHMLYFGDKTAERGHAVWWVLPLSPQREAWTGPQGPGTLAAAFPGAQALES